MSRLFIFIILIRSKENKSFGIKVEEYLFLKSFTLRFRERSNLKDMIQDFAKPIRGTQNARTHHPHGVLKYLLIFLTVFIVSAFSYYAFIF